MLTVNGEDVKRVAVMVRLCLRMLRAFLNCSKFGQIKNKDVYNFHTRNLSCDLDVKLFQYLLYLENIDPHTFEKVLFIKQYRKKRAIMTHKASSTPNERAEQKNQQWNKAQHQQNKAD